MATEEEVRNIWKAVDAVCFDVDSTVIQEEGIDELAKFCGKGDEVSKLTKQAMTGNVSFRDAFSARLDIIKPQMNQIRDFVKTQPPRLTPGVNKCMVLCLNPPRLIFMKKLHYIQFTCAHPILTIAVTLRCRRLVEELHRKGVAVYLVSGGLRGVITPTALELNIPLQNVFANRLKFFYNGEYAGFDETEPTSMSGGKGKVIEQLKKSYNYVNLVMIGDGATDAEACPPADAFIGYGGNVIRESVKAKSKWFVTNFQELIDAL